MIRGEQHVDDWAEIAVDYLDGQLDHDTRVAVEAHLAGCPECAARLRRQQYVVSVLQETALDDPPEDLEYRSIGQIIFPSPGDEPVFTPVEDKKVYHTPRWYRELRHWVPAAVAVVALLSAVVAYGIVRTGSGSPSMATTTMLAGVTSTTAAAATTAAPALGEHLDTAAGMAVSTTVAASAATTTTAAAAGAAPSTTAARNATLGTTGDPKAMVKTLQTADAPTFVAFQANSYKAAVEDTTVGSSASTVTTAAGGTGSTAPATTETPAANVTVTSAPSPVSSDAASTLAEQITEFTGLQPVDKSLWLGGPTFAVYLPHKDASKLVDMVRSISASLDLTVTAGGEPPAAAQENAVKLLEQKASFPVLEAHRAAQPATWGYNFTTSTLVPPDQVAGYKGPYPDQDGEHVLVVIWIAQ